MIKRVCIGIDPGSSSGGLAVIYSYADSKVKLEAYEFNKLTETEICEKLLLAKDCAKENYIFAIVEQVHSMPGQGVSSSFKFGHNYGLLRGMLLALKIPFDQATPQKWIKLYGMKKDKNENRTQWKKRLKEKAQQLFPDYKVRTNTADAILIANYCYHKL